MLEKNDLIGMYRKLLEVRSFEEKARELYAAGRIPGFIHLSIGQEAVPVGVCSALRKDDYLLSTHRGHGHLIARGAPAKFVLAELYGKKTGVCQGRGGSLHLIYMNLNIIGCSGIVGSSIPIANGPALTAKIKKTGQVSVVFFGDGSTNTGAFHEGVNLASIWKLPVLFVCENNQYAITMSYTRSMRVKNISDRAQAYGIPGITVDGMDVVKVREAADEAIQRVRQGEGPIFLECKTYRFVGHHQGDPIWGGYRTKEEVEKWMESCPLKKLEPKLIESKILSNQEMEKIKEEVKGTMEEAVRFAEESPLPDPEDALKELYTA